MSKTVQISAELVECTVEVVAEPGDMLVVWEGRCLGVHRADPTGKSAPVVPPRSQIVVTDQVILQALSVRDMTTMQLADHLGISRTNPYLRAQVGASLRRMQKAAIVEPVVNDGRSTMHEWRLMSVHRREDSQPTLPELRV